MGAQHRQLKLEAKMPRWVDIGGVPETLYQGLVTDFSASKRGFPRQAPRVCGEQS
jgi:hypothetical protein